MGRKGGIQVPFSSLIQRLVNLYLLSVFTIHSNCFMSFPLNYGSVKGTEHVFFASFIYHSDYHFSQ